jgi:hypothetical protein
MNAAELIAQVRADGAELAVRGGALVLKGSPDALERWSGLLKAAKSAVLEALGGQRELGEHGELAAPSKLSPERGAVVTRADVHDDIPDCSEAEAVELRYAYEERVGIRLYDAGYTRHEAERLAYGETIEKWCERHPLRLQPGSCAGCGEPLATGALELPDGARVHWERDQEFRCLIAYGFKRKRRAVQALAVMGIVPPANLPDDFGKNGKA